MRTLETPALVIFCTFFSERRMLAFPFNKNANIGRDMNSFYCIAKNQCKRVNPPLDMVPSSSAGGCYSRDAWTAEATFSKLPGNEMTGTSFYFYFLI